MNQTKSCTPLISIVLTTYNSEKVIEKTLKGIIEQSFPLNRAELIVVDGGSKDDTPKIIEEFVERNAKSFYDVKVFIHDRNYGISKARSDGIKTSRGRYILILDHDVIMSRDTIVKLLQYLESTDRKVVAVMPLHNSTCRGTISSWEYLIRKGKIWRTNAITSCALVRRELFDEIGLYDETLGPPYTIYEDIEFGARALSKGYEIHLLGTLEVVHETCEEAQEAPSNEMKYKGFINKVKTSSRYIRILKTILDQSYRYALRKYLHSAPVVERIKWHVYAVLTALSIPITATLLIGFAIPLYMWFLALTAMYLDIVRRYWNGKVFYISLAYAFVAYIWRLIRSVALLLPARI
jgi:glycosyltransferase involved in cell wall biosynthesis